MLANKVDQLTVFDHISRGMYITESIPKYITM